MRLARPMLFLSTVGLLACSSTDYGSNPGGGSSCTPSGNDICLTASSYNPVTLTITSGTTVTWRDGSGIAHTVTSDPGSADVFDIGVSAGAIVSHQFMTPGTFPYHCQFHGGPGTGMHGTITVN
jgi:plastocyanin